MTLDTVADYVREARVLLQDQVVPYRYPDADLVSALNMGILRARFLRPDLFIGTTTLPSFTANDTTTFSMDVQYRVPFVYFIAGHAQMRDEEDTQDNRSAAFLSMFAKQLAALG